MKAWLLEKLGAISQDSQPLRLREVEIPRPGAGELLIKVMASGVCHTELDEIEGRTPPSHLPVIPGHQVVGRVVETGADCHHFRSGDRVGVAWIYSSCGLCLFCREKKENLCPDFKATGRDRNGGYAEYMAVPEQSAYQVPEEYEDAEAAPLLCGGAIGYRSLRLAGIVNGETLGLTGFGASAHQVLQLARYLYPDSKVIVFARRRQQQELALLLGAAWSGKSCDQPPWHPHAVIDTTPAWQPVLDALGVLEPGGRLVINAIRKEEADKEALLGLSYEKQLWLEKEVKSVANICRDDVSDFLSLAKRAGIRPQIQAYKLEEANQALVDLKIGKGVGAKVLVLEADR